MSDGPHDQGRSAEDDAKRDGLGRRLSTSPLKAGGNYSLGFVLIALGVGAIVLLVFLGVPRTGGGTAGSIALGLLGLLFVSTGISTIRDGIAVQGRNVHTHERGLLVETKEGPLPLPYADLLVFRQQTDHKKGATTVYTEVSWQFERRDGTPWEIRTESTEGLQDLFEATLANACAVQAAPQAAALAAGSTLTYGDVSFDGHRLRAPGLDVAWTEVKNVSVSKGQVTVLVPRDGRLVKELWQLVGMVGKIPNFPLFWSLFQQAFTNSRPGASASAGPSPAGPPTSAGEVHGQGGLGSPPPPTTGSSDPGSMGGRS